MSFFLLADQEEPSRPAFSVRGRLAERPASASPRPTASRTSLRNLAMIPFRQEGDINITIVGRNYSSFILHDYRFGAHLIRFILWCFSRLVHDRFRRPCEVRELARAPSFSRSVGNGHVSPRVVGGRVMSRA